MTTYPPAETAQTRSLWFSLLAGPVVWTVYFMIGYSLAEIACRAGFLQGFYIFGLTALSAIIVGLTVIALGVTGYAGFLSYRQWRQQREQEGEKGRAERSREFMALAGVMLGGLFTLLILLTGVPALVLPPC